MSFDFDLVKMLYFAEKPVKTLSVDGKDVNLICTIIYNANGAGSGTAPAYQEGAYGDTITLRTNTGSLAKTGYSFGGWNTAADGTGTTYAAGGSFTIPAGNTTLYAKWQQVYTVTFNTNINSSGNQYYISGQSWASGQQPTSTATKTINAGSSIGTFPSSVNIPSSSAKSYTLSSVTYTTYISGWNTKADGSGTTVTTSTVPTGNVTYYAIWRLAANVAVSSTSFTCPKFANNVYWSCTAGGGSRSASSITCSGTIFYAGMCLSGQGYSGGTNSGTTYSGAAGQTVTVGTYNIKFGSTEKGNVSSPGNYGTTSANVNLKSTVTANASGKFVVGNSNFGIYLSWTKVSSSGFQDIRANFYVNGTAYGNAYVAGLSWRMDDGDPVSVNIVSDNGKNKTGTFAGDSNNASGGWGVTQCSKGSQHSVSVGAAGGAGYSKYVEVRP